LFELRGRSKTEVLNALRDARVGGPAKKRRTRRSAQQRDAETSEPVTETPAVSLGTLRAEQFDVPRAPLPSLHFSFEAPEHDGAVLRQLGAPAAWSAERPPAEVLAPLVRAAAEAARRIALAEAEEAARPAAKSHATPKPPKPERPVAKQRKRRPAR
jgi:uncharacterized Zn finger protein